MGAWGVDTFENDMALDWVLGLEETSDLELVRATLQGVVETGDYLDADPACEALAACEVIAALKGRWGAHDETVDQWVEAHPGPPPDALVTLAVAAIDRVLAEPSELLDLWKETADFDAWKASVASLRTRVFA